MPRVTRGNKKLLRRKKILKLAKGFFGAKRKNYRSAKEAVEKGEYFPLARPIFIYVSEAAYKRPEVQKFVSFYLFPVLTWKK